MRLAFIHGAAAVVVFSLPAFASTGGGLSGVPDPHYTQVATNAEEEAPLAAAFAIFERLNLEEAGEAVREGQYRAQRVEEIGNPNVPEDQFDDNLRCVVIGAIGAPIKCVHYSP